MERPMFDLGDVCKFQNGFAFKSKLFTDAGVPILRISNIQSGSIDLRRIAYTDPDSYKENLDKYRVVDGDLLIAMSGATTGKIGINHTGLEFLLNQRVGKFIPGDRLDKQYLYYYLSTKVEENLEMSAGAAQPNLSTEQIKRIEIPLPPIPEQKRIVAILDQAFANIEQARAKTEQNLKNARELFESYLQEVFSQRGTGWFGCQMSDICEITSKLVDPREKEYIELPHVGAGNMISSTGELVDVKTAREEGLISGKFVFDESMVLYSKIRPYLMKVCRPDFMGLCSADVYPLLPVEGKVDRNYLFYLLLSKDFTDYAISGSGRAGMPKVNRTHLFNYPVTVPNIEIQRDYVAKLDQIAKQSQALERLYLSKLYNLDELKKSILQKAFMGELTKEESKGAAA